MVEEVRHQEAWVAVVEHLKTVTEVAVEHQKTVMGEAGGLQRMVKVEGGAQEGHWKSLEAVEQALTSLATALGPEQRVRSVGLVKVEARGVLKIVLVR